MQLHTMLIQLYDWLTISEIMFIQCSLFIMFEIKFWFSLILSAMTEKYKLY